jgi:haloacetate dehalogenase
MEATMSDFFPGFEQRQIGTSGATINLVTGGSGPPLLLLHGYPQTHVMWRKVALRLAQDFTVVVPDLRGYGDSSKPPAGENFINYSKRALALDQVEVMAALGHGRFAVAGHDRGARVTHRLLRDHPDKVTRGATLDIVPTLYRFETIDQKAATGSWHWFFLIQGRGLPEHMIGSDPEFFLRHMFGTLLHDEDTIGPAVWNEYLRCFRNPETIRATCDEYRAGASIDLVHDRADLAQKVRVPMLVLWGMRSGQGSGYDVLKVWRDHADDVRGLGIDSGHFIPEEQPGGVYAALKEFFSV